MIEYCVSTYNTAMREKAYKCYVSDLLMNLAKANGIKVKARYYDLAYTAQNAVEETRTPEEIVSTISEKLRRLGEGE